MADETEITAPPEPETDTDSRAQAKKTATPRPANGNALRLVKAVVDLNATANPAAAEAVALYNIIADDRPIKLTSKQAHFERQGAAKHPEIACGKCYHWVKFVAPARVAQQNGACEVVRADDGNPSIDEMDYCHLAFTTDGETFPMRGKTEAEESKE